MKQFYKILMILNVLFLCAVPFAEAEYSNEPIHWGFKKGSDGKAADAGKPLEKIIEKHGAVYKGDPNKKDIYLTFDNGYENGYTEQILAVLKQEKVPATFFVTGHYLESAPELVEQMVYEGHTIGNHSWHHPDMTRISDERIKEELEKVRAATAELTGKKTMAYLRPPRGIFSERTMDIAKQAGYTHVFWSLAFVDWNTDQQKGWKYSYDKIMSQIHPGAVILLHTVSKDNADALEKVVKDLKKQGYTFKTLDDLMISQAIKEPMLH
ncbi:delta-lactam-biosynthetic de-N-acetylase [Bacillus sp. T33-2]|uniref:delta-lactam-biosynthetic de-N-acetylase n=1 Tax=Bacillus sp. T33-2 TaxID=2054168 RepID=UPI000C777390|nr:delta-lactam-biosynthetic de-N-acetylase [Bacillus sp. T33-2]PLR92869.1 delta-lactam-biosynthetic de-N-acetylase [Bacillus sp. T33-2]